MGWQRDHSNHAGRKCEADVHGLCCALDRLRAAALLDLNVGGAGGRLVVGGSAVRVCLEQREAHFKRIIRGAVGAA